MRQLSVSLLHDLQHGRATFDVRDVASERSLRCGHPELTSEPQQHTELIPVESVERRALCSVVVVTVKAINQQSVPLFK